MALGTVTRTYSARVLLDIAAQFVAGGDMQAGLALPALKQSLSFVDGVAAPATDPNLTGWLYQSGLVFSAGTNVLIASATDPFGAAGDAVYSDRAFSPANQKLKLIWAKAPSTNTAGVFIAKKSAGGITIFNATSTGMYVPIGGTLIWYDPTGDLSGALTTTVNDGFVIGPASGTQVLDLLFLYGL